MDKLKIELIEENEKLKYLNYRLIKKINNLRRNKLRLKNKLNEVINKQSEEIEELKNDSQICEWVQVDLRE
tara:strand:- start:212 stop:424 length:213 start_codon:yes stop_codon:yes gene_type:complete